MFAKSFFENDNFSSRRTTGNNMFDPEALLTEGESRQGFDYDNSQRDWPSQAVYEAACNGDIPADLVPTIAPRVFTSRGYGRGCFANGPMGFICNSHVNGQHVARDLTQVVETWPIHAPSLKSETPQQEVERYRAELRNGQKNPRRLLCM